MALGLPANQYHDVRAAFLCDTCGTEGTNGHTDLGAAHREGGVRPLDARPLVVSPEEQYCFTTG